MQHNMRAFVCLLMAGCTVGAPPGFSGGDQWTFPLVGPLEDGLLITPVSINGHGPYLFAIDPDANVSAIDKQVVEEAGLRTGTGPRRIDETNTGQIRVYAEVLHLKVANLTIDRRDVMVFPEGFYDTEGRHVRGILGRDVLADSLVFGFDRDHGIAMLSTGKAFTPPQGATILKYQSVSSAASSIVSNVSREQAAGQSGAPLPDVVPVPRRLFHAEIAENTFTMHLDLGASVSQLRRASWDKAKLTPLDLKLRLVDEAATPHQITEAGWSDVNLGSSKTLGVTFVPYLEKRFDTAGVDGALGLDFFRPYAVYANWDRKTYYLKGRSDAVETAPARMGRWGALIPACPHPGCVTAELQAADGGVVLQVQRDAEAADRALEVFLGVTPAPGKSVGPLVVELPNNASSLSAPLTADYAGATLRVLDVSPFPRACVGGTGCVVPLAAPIVRPPEPASTAPSSTTAAPRNVPMDKLRLVAGERQLPPSADVLQAAAGKPLALAIVRVCLSADGKVDTTKVVKSSGVPAYDDQLQRTIQATWTFEPVAVEGQPAPVCTSATFQGR